MGKKKHLGSIVVAEKVWLSVSCGRKGGGSNQRVTRDDSHMCLVAGMCVRVRAGVLSIFKLLKSKSVKNKRTFELSQLCLLSPHLPQTIKVLHWC